MGTIAWIIAGLTLGIASPFMVLQLQRLRDVARADLPAGQARRVDAVRPANPFAAVSIRLCADSPCTAVQQMQQQRYLAVRAPALPVPGCDRKKCGCRYIRHADRRTPSDRRDVFARFGGLTPTVRKERRTNGDDRRKPR